MIDNFRLRIFSAVAGLGSFTAAAKALGLSQPAVSQNISELERFAGGRLLRRSRSGVELTEKGRRLLAQAEVVLRECSKLENDFRAPQSILLKAVLLGPKRCNILVRDGRFADLDAPEETPAAKKEGPAAIPANILAAINAAVAVVTHDKGRVTKVEKMR